jgi:hypothetical protein
LREELAKIDPATGRRNVQMIAEIAVAHAKSGEAWAITHIANRLEGLPNAPVTIEDRRDDVRLFTDAELERMIAEERPNACSTMR